MRRVVFDGRPKGVKDKGGVPKMQNGPFWVKKKWKHKHKHTQKGDKATCGSHFPSVLWMVLH